jgi:uncharacterized protein YdhG (YjbR/CyaY superfamily)
MADKPSTVDEYIAGFPPDTRAILDEVRATMRRAVPTAREAISYDIPTYQLDGRDVVYFAGWKGHVSVYPLPGGDPDLVAEMAPYQSGKGTLRFSLSAPIPYALIGRVAAQLVADRTEASGERPDHR